MRLQWLWPWSLAFDRWTFGWMDIPKMWCLQPRLSLVHRYNNWLTNCLMSHRTWQKVGQEWPQVNSFCCIRSNWSNVIVPLWHEGSILVWLLLSVLHMKHEFHLTAQSCPCHANAQDACSHTLTLILLLKHYRGCGALCCSELKKQDMFSERKHCAHSFQLECNCQWQFNN